MSKSKSKKCPRGGGGGGCNCSDCCDKHSYCDGTSSQTDSNADNPPENSGDLLVDDWSTVAAENCEVGGVPIGKSPRDIPAQVQAIMAGVADLRDIVTDLRDVVNCWEQLQTAYEIRKYEGDAFALLVMEPCPTWYVQAEADDDGNLPVEAHPSVVYDCQGRAWKVCVPEAVQAAIDAAGCDAEPATAAELTAICDDLENHYVVTWIGSRPVRIPISKLVPS